MRGLIAVIGVAALAGCATSNALPERTETRTIAIQNVSGKLTTTSSSTASVATVSAPIEQVWRILPALLDSLGVPVALIEPAKHVIGNEGFKIRQRLGKAPLSRYMDCGTTQIGPNADSYDVYLTVLVQLQPAASGTTSVSTSFESLARPIAFSQDYSRCSTKGLFESRLIELVKAQVQR